MAFSLDPFPKVTEKALSILLNARILVFSVVIAKITLDRLYKYAMIINPKGYDEYGEATLDILEYRDPATPDDIFNTLNGYGAKGRQAYLSYLFYDAVFVIARSAPVLVLCAWSYRKVPSKFRPGIWIPLVNIGADLLESLLLFINIKIFPQRIQLLEAVTTWVIKAKKYSLYLTLALMFIALLVGIYYGFHGVLADSVVMEKDRQDKLRAREQIQGVLQRSAARQATAAAAGRSAAIKKNS